MADLDKRLVAALVIAVLISFGLGFKYGQYTEGRRSLQASLTSALKQSGDGSTNEPKDIFVYVAGRVENPGVIKLRAGERVFQAVQQAVPMKDADLTGLNLATPVMDGETIIVPKLGDETTAVEGASSVSNDASLNRNGGLVNINRASVEEMDQRLPGIGPALAQRIVNYRREHGGFRSIEELQEVSGIGEKRFMEIKDLICIR